MAIIKHQLKLLRCWAVVVHPLNLSTLETEAGGSPSSRSAWSSYSVSGQPELHSETLPQKKKKNTHSDLVLLYNNCVSFCLFGLVF